MIVLTQARPPIPKIDQKYSNSTQGTYYATYHGDNGDPYQVTRTHPVLDRTSVDELEKEVGLKVSLARLCTSGSVDGKMAYREIYIHAKLMIIDDVFVTLGSANMNQRSMSVDSEINIGVTGVDHASKLRGDVFGMHSGNTISGDGGRERMPDVYQDWESLMNENYKKWRAGRKELKGFLVKFEDQRSTSTKHAMNTLPPFTGVQTALT